MGGIIPPIFHLNESSALLRQGITDMTSFTSMNILAMSLFTALFAAKLSIGYRSCKGASIVPFGDSIWNTSAWSSIERASKRVE